MQLKKLSFKLLILFSISIGWNNSLFSQKKCGTVEFNQLLKKQLKKSFSEKQFENWIRDKSLLRKEQKSARNKVEDIYIIPVVVHVIHNGENLNSGGNIPDAQIKAQIDSLNKDFRRLNADKSETPLEFESVAADINIEFVLAKRDPEGLATTGIIRKKGSQTRFSINEGLALSAQSYWPAEDYLNIWVADLNAGLLGFAQFPTSNIEGLEEEQSISRLSDGVALDWKFTGTNYETGAFASLGRTATHEVGHFLGLRHIWGDGDCSKDDYCADTPNQEGSSSDCPVAGSKSSCGSVDMFQNYMDFTDDICMNLFTVHQSDRMRTVMENSPRRKSLITSKGATNPVFVANDLGIKEIITPQNGECTSEIIPQIEVKNYGSNNITEFTVDFYMDENLQESISANTNLTYLSTSSVSFSPISNNSSTNNSIFRFEIKNTNSVTDGNSENNIQSIVVNFHQETIIPFTENFENSLLSWSVFNSSNDNSATSISNAPNLVFENKAYSFNYFDSPTSKFGELDWLISPVFDLSALPTADLTLKYAYAPLAGNITDVLTIAISTDCGTTFLEQNYIFQEFSPDFETSPTISENFIPEGPTDWKEITISLTDFSGNANIVIAIIGHNGNGNNIYIDDFQLSSDNIFGYNLGIVKLKSMPLSTCIDDIFPIIEVKNFGFETITDFDIKYSFANFTKTIKLNEISLLPGKTKSVLIPIRDISPNEYQIEFEVININGNTDEQPSNNIIQRNFNISESTDIIPIREEFEGNFADSNWEFIRADSSHNISIKDADGNGINNKSIVVNNFNLSYLNSENWLISPKLDVSKSPKASMFFKVSYANKIGRNDKLEVKLSTNCGLSFDHTIYSKKGSDLAIKESNIEWFPETEADWITEFIDLSEYTIWANIRIAFVFTNQNGNNIFLDDIEFFTSDSPKIFTADNSLLRVFPNPAASSFNVKFDFDTKDDLTVSLISMTGDVVFRNEVTNILNQEVNIDVRILKNGIYILHIRGENTNLFERILIDN